MFSLLLLIFVGTCAFIYFFGKKEKKGDKEIPGPTGLPFIGNAHQVGKKAYLKINEWQDQYGEIYQMKLGNIKNIMISNPKMIKDLFMNDNNFTGPMNFEGFDIYEDEKLGIVSTEGEMWEVHRRFLLRQLRDFGFGKAAMEELISEELQEVIRKFKECEGKPVKDLKKTLVLAVINSLWTVLAKKRFDHDDPKLHKLVDNIQKSIDEVFPGGLLLFFPWLRHIAPELSGYNRLRKVLDDAKNWFESEVKEHKQAYQEDNLGDFIDVYLSEVKKTTDPNSVFYGDLAERQLVTILSDLFFAGSDTTSTTLGWGIMYICKFPQVQKKLQDEIEKVTNNSRSVSVTDRPNMPYTLALIDEILRYSSIVPNGLSHRALEDKVVQGYFIAKGTMVTPNLYYIHHEKKFWGDPEQFRPERFIENGKYKKSERLIPFQIGRRQCAGETLARDTIFLFITNLFQRFEMKFENDVEPDMEPHVAFQLQPKPYSVVMKDRLQ